MKTPAIPSYWKSHLDEKIKRVKALQNDQTITFGMITDVHWGHNEKNSGPLMEYVLNACDAPYFFLAGDVVSAYYFCEIESLQKDVDECLSSFSTAREKCLIVKGNHDAAYSTLGGSYGYKETVPKADFNDFYFCDQRKYPNRIFGEDDSYYYVDDEVKKVRFIVLNSHDVPSDERLPDKTAKYNPMDHFGFLQKQIEWLANVALKVPSSDYTLILCAHAPPKASFKLVEKDPPTSWRDRYYNYELVLGLLNAFSRGESFSGKLVYDDPLFNAEISADFTGKGGNVAAWLFGHTHLDAIELYGNISCVQTTTDASFESIGLNVGSRGTTDEQAFDLFTVDTATRTVYVTRIGKGKDRSFHY